MIQLGRLEGFYWVARTGGYARAARAFPYPITQPGVHQQVKKLEADLGQALFERVGKDRMQLTPAGRALYQFVAPFLERLPEVTRSLQPGAVGGTLRVQAAGLPLRHLVPGWLRRLQARRPDIQVELAEAHVSDAAPLLAGECDLFVDHLDPVPRGVAVRQVGVARAFLALPAHHPLSRRKRLALGELSGEPFIAYGADARLRSLQLEALAQHGVRPARVHQADSSETILAFVAAGLGYSLVPSLSEAGPRVAGVAAQRLVRPAAEFPIYAAWRESASANPLLLAALEVAPG